MFISCCTSPDDNKKSNIIENLENLEEDLTIDDSSINLILVEIKPNVTVYWNPENSTIVQDSSFNYVELNFNTLGTEIIEAILDTTETTLKICDAKTNVVIGDIAFILAKKIAKCSYVEIFDVEMDAYVDCLYPSGFLESLHLNRKMAKVNLQKCHEKKGHIR